MIRWLSPKGRIGRGTYWWAYLIPLVIAQVGLWVWSAGSFLAQLSSQMEIMIQLFDNLNSRAIGTSEHQAAAQALQDEAARFDAAGMLWAQLAIVLLCIPLLAGTAKRWRDIGQSGWWSLLLLIPGLGYIILFLLGCLRGRPQPAIAA